MAKTRSARTIKVSKENKAKLAKMFNCTDRMVCAQDSACCP